MNNPAFLKAQKPVEIIAILDRSGSMGLLAKEAIQGFNKFLAEQKALPGEALLTLVLFNGTVETVLKAVPLKDVADLTAATYVPDGMTALNDAIGVSISGLLERAPDKAIVVILTDGYENASQTYNQERARALIKTSEEKGYETVYLAANQDAIAVAKDSYGIKISNAANFAATGVGTMDAFVLRASVATTNYRAGEQIDMKDKP